MHIAFKITEKLPRLHHHKDFKSLVQTPEFRPRKAFNMTSKLARIDLNKMCPRKEIKYCMDCYDASIMYQETPWVIIPEKTSDHIWNFLIHNSSIKQEC